MWHGELMYGLMRPWARYVRRLMCGARLTYENNTVKNSATTSFTVRIRYLDVVYDEVVSVEALVLGIRLCVLEEVEQKLGRLLGPATLRGAVHLGLSKKQMSALAD